MYIIQSFFIYIINVDNININYIIQDGSKYTAYAFNSAGPAFTVSNSVTGIVVYEQQDSSNVFKEVTNVNAAEATKDIKHWALFDCTAGVCERVYGYRKIGSRYASLSYTYDNELLTEEDLTEKKCTSSADIGQLLSDGSLCLVPNDTAASQVKGTMADGNYLLSGGQNLVFAELGQDQSVVVKATSNSFTLKPLTAVNILKVDEQVVSTPTTTDFSNATSAAKIFIYQCSELHACHSVNGYVKDAGVYYAMDNATGASKITPVQVSCSSHVGEIVKDADEVNYFCLTSTSMISLAAPTGKHYIVGTTATTSKINSNKLIKITSDYIIEDITLDGIYINFFFNK